MEYGIYIGIMHGSVGLIHLYRPSGNYNPMKISTCLQANYDDLRGLWGGFQYGYTSPEHPSRPSKP